MEGYVFALMANSGTDPDLEEEDALREKREKELELRYLVKMDEDDKRPAARSSSVERFLERTDSDLAGEPAVLDHYSAYWPDGVSAPSPPPVLSPRKISLSPTRSDETVSKVDSFSTHFNHLEKLPEVPEVARQYLIRDPDHAQKTLQLLHRPAPFRPYSSARTYVTLPPLRVSLPSFRRNPLPVGLGPLQQSRRLRAADPLKIL